MERFTKVMVNKYRSQEAHLWKNPFHVRLLLEISIRARRSTERSIDSLEQGEFYLSETEYAKFDLKSTEKGKIARAIKKFIEADFIEKVEGKIGSKGGYVYRLLDSCPFQASFQDSDQIREGIGNGQGTSRDERSKKKYSNKKISKMKFEEQVQTYDTDRHDEFVSDVGNEETRRIKKARLKQYK